MADALPNPDSEVPVGDEYSTLRKTIVDLVTDIQVRSQEARQASEGPSIAPLEIVTDELFGVKWNKSPRTVEFNSPYLVGTSPATGHTWELRLNTDGGYSFDLKTDNPKAEKLHNITVRPQMVLTQFNSGDKTTEPATVTLTNSASRQDTKYQFPIRKE